jgi:hypothetical protein
VKLGSRPLGRLFLGLCAGIGCAGLVHAQYLTTSDVTWTGTINIVCTNYSTLVQYSWLLVGAECENIVRVGPLVRNGNDFLFDFDLTKTSGGLCPQFIANMNTPVDLGMLAPDAYTLITTSWGTPVATNTFTVAPALQANGFDTNGCFQIQMSCGFTNVNYVIQCSTDLVNWTSLSTNTVATNAVGVTWTDSYPASPGFRVYRVLCQ